MKNFDTDFYFFLDKIKHKDNFSLSRWGDGELKIINGEKIDIRSKGNGEFRYDPLISDYNIVRDKLLESFTKKDDGYYVGIACRCCVGDDKHLKMKKMSNQNESNLTWANIFVNSNYKKTINELIPELKNRIVNLVVNKNSILGDLTFNVKNVWYVGIDAWYADYNIFYEIKNYVETNNIKDEVFLFAAGPLANILVYELWFNISKNNTYIDIGSILDGYLKLKLTRGYQLGASTLNKTCIW